MKDKKEKIPGTLSLRVVESLQDDVYKGIARIDPTLMKKLNLERGDIISIKDGRETHLIVDRAYPSDLGEEIIRIDGIARKNAKTSIGSKVDVKKAEITEAKKITIAPAQKGIVVQGDPENFKRGLIGKPVSKGDLIVIGGTQKRRDIMNDGFGELFGEDFTEFFSQMGLGIPGGLTQLRFVAVSTTPNNPSIITENTQITLSTKAVESFEDSIPQITYEDIGGLSEEVKKLREMVELPLKRPEIFSRLGIEPPKGVLLYGPPGTGKTLLAKAVANESEANFITINGPEIFNKFYGESEKRIREIFEEAEKNAPAIIFIDELDAVAPSRESNIGSGEVERRVVSQLLTMMDGLQSRGKVIVMAATNRPESIDAALRRPGRFDREIEINAPSREGRLSILKIHTRGMPLTKDVKLEEIASKTHGFVGADLAALTKEAAMSVLRRNLHKFNIENNSEAIPMEILENLRVTKGDFDEALKFVQPSAMREVLIETPNVRWEDIGGIENIKRDLKEAIEWPLKYPQSFTRMGIRPPKGVLLYGPPGTGKTLLAKAIARESEVNFIKLNGPELQKEGIVGKETERLRKMFKRAKQVSPSIIFIDEIDSFAKRRGGYGTISDSNESLINTLLTELDGLEDLRNVIVIGATNRPDILDPALMRPGRFDRIVFVPIPEKEERLKIFQIHTKNMPLNKDVNLPRMAEDTEGYTGADIESLVREAAILALRENIETENVTKKHFDLAMEKVRPSVSKSDQERYKQVEQKYLRSAKAALAETSYTG
ncbi:MAG: CDC48 family AAA ATPase [Nanoarchaeota archaeon]|nr:CDC48 family AAA ATPase [Nanoarchaeota archaeon]